MTLEWKETEGGSESQLHDRRYVIDLWDNRWRCRSIYNDGTQRFHFPGGDLDKAKADCQIHFDGIYSL